MIPFAIRAEHIRAAIHQVRAHGVPKERESTGYDLLYEGRLYPPKYIVSLAAQIATGTFLTPEAFSGGDETNSFLSNLNFQVRPKGDTWSEAECYFAVWGYDQLDLDRKVVKKNLYREISRLIGRSEKSVEYKIQNVSSIDPRPRKEKPISEAPNVQKLLRVVFRSYWANRDRARLLYDEYYEQFVFLLAPSGEGRPPDDLLDPPTFLIEEGAPSASTGIRRKRSQKLIEKGREYFRKLDSEGKLRCKACGFTSPENISGEIVHLHHTEPITDFGEAGKSLEFAVAVKLLVPLCPTYHQIAHVSRPPYSVEVIKQLRGI